MNNSDVPEKDTMQGLYNFYGISKFMFCLWRDSGISNRAHIVKRLILDNDWWTWFMVVYPQNIYEQIFSMIHCTTICSPYVYDVCR